MEQNSWGTFQGGFCPPAQQQAINIEPKTDEFVTRVGVDGQHCGGMCQGVLLPLAFSHEKYQVPKVQVGMHIRGAQGTVGRQWDTSLGSVSGDDDQERHARCFSSSIQWDDVTFKEQLASAASAGTGLYLQSCEGIQVKLHPLDIPHMEDQVEDVQAGVHIQRPQEDVRQWRSASMEWAQGIGQTTNSGDISLPVWQAIGVWKDSEQSTSTGVESDP